LVELSSMQRLKIQTTKHSQLPLSEALQKDTVLIFLRFPLLARKVESSKKIYWHSLMENLPNNLPLLAQSIKLVQAEIALLRWHLLPVSDQRMR
jgi:hypothetical protein